MMQKVMDLAKDIHSPVTLIVETDEQRNTLNAMDLKTMVL